MPRVPFSRKRKGVLRKKAYPIEGGRGRRVKGRPTVPSKPYRTFNKKRYVLLEYGVSSAMAKSLQETFKERGINARRIQTSPGRWSVYVEHQFKVKVKPEDREQVIQNILEDVNHTAPNEYFGFEEKWFNPEKHRGWRKEQSAELRRKKLLDSTDKRKNLKNRYLEAARAMQALANVTKDSETEEKATKDAEYFFKLVQ